MQDNYEFKTVPEKAVDAFGDEHQLRIAQEEHAEIIQAISKYLRNDDVGSLLEELADVTIMNQQIKYILSKKLGEYEFDKRFTEIYKIKLHKLGGYLPK